MWARSKYPHPPLPFDEGCGRLAKVVPGQEWRWKESDGEDNEPQDERRDKDRWTRRCTNDGMNGGTNHRTNDGMNDEDG